MKNMNEKNSNKNKKVSRKFKTETPKALWTDEFIGLRRKLYSFKCGGDSKNKLKGVSKSQTKHIKFEDEKNVDMERNIKENVMMIF